MVDPTNMTKIWDLYFIFLAQTVTSAPSGSTSAHDTRGVRLHINFHIMRKVLLLGKTLSNGSGPGHKEILQAEGTFLIINLMLYQWANIKALQGDSVLPRCSSFEE